VAVRPPSSPEPAPAPTTATDAKPSHPETDQKDSAGRGRPGTEAGNGSHRKGKGPLGFLRELPALIVIAFLLALLIKSFLVQAFYIPSASMEPTLKPGDRVLVNKVVYHLHPPRRGDIIVFANPDPSQEPDRGVVGGFFHWITEGLGISPPADEDFIKRVIGLPGDVIEERANGDIYVNGHRLVEPYLKGRDFRAGGLGPFPPVPKGELFVMGDNRGNSNDSRFGLGTVPIDRVIGKAFVIIWPPSRFGGMAGGTRLA
jgi:signal peptidase I